MTRHRLPRPGTILGLLFRLPAPLYCLHLGWLLGHGFLMVTHRGRTSGQLRRTVLEVIHFDPATRESVVIAAWGERSDWYRKFMSSPAVMVHTAGQRYAPIQEFVTPDRTTRLLAAYAHDHPWQTRLLGTLLGITIADPDGRRRFLEAARIVAFRPQPAG